MKTILFIIGSFRERSFNRQLAERAARYVEQGGAKAQFLEYRDVPFVNQDIDYPVPEPVSRIRKEVAEADGLWLISPEYNHSYSGVIKNAIDWLSRPVDPLDRKTPSVLAGKKAVISGAAGNDAAIDARLNMVNLLNAVKVEVIGGEGMGVALDKEAFVSDELKLSDEEEEQLEELAKKLLENI